MACDICDILSAKKGFLYEDEHAATLLSPTPAGIGHFWVVPKQHATIVEQLPQTAIASMVRQANKSSMALFEALGGGTNVIVQNGVPAGQAKPHVIMHVIARRENDGLNLQWAPKQLSEEEMGTVELMLKDAAAKIIIGEEKPKEEKPVEEKPKPAETAKGEDYRIRHLRRIP